jgi:hypothetical protein
MGRLTFWIIFLVALYSGYWFVGSRAVGQALNTAIVDARQDGWQVAYEALDTSGFPGQFDISVTDADIVAPDGKWAWRAPSLQVFAPSMQPTHLSAIFARTQALRLGDQTLQIDSTEFQVNAATRLNTALSFDAASVVITGATVQSDFGWRIDLGRVLASFVAEPETAATYNLDVDTVDLALPEPLIAQIAPDSGLSNTIARVDLDGSVTLDKPLDRFAFDGDVAQPMAEQIVLTGFDLNWGDIALNAAGTLDIDAQGIPDGRITFKTAQWWTIIDILVAAGAIDPGIAPTLTNVASAMAQDGGMLELPVTFQDGFMSMGLLPLGPAPRFR